MVDRYDEMFDRLLASKRVLDLRVAQNDELAGRLRELRAWQTQRLEQTYAGLRRERRYVPALKFFFSDLYGPDDAVRRDEDLRRALARLKRALPATLLEVLCMALQLQVLTADLDQEMVAQLQGGAVDEASYAAAYRAVGRREDRSRQIELLARIGEELSVLVRQKWVGFVLRAAHLPAHAAGFGALQSFLERGFEAFRQIGDGQYLLGTIRACETELMESLLSGDAAAIRRSRARRPAELARGGAAGG